MAKISFTVNDREVVLRYDVQAIVDVEEIYDTMDEAQKRMSGKGKSRARAVLDVLACMANAGARHEKREADFTPDWFVQNLTPAQYNEARVLIQRAIIVGNYRECSTDDDREVDAVLEEIRKKKELMSPAEN